jgi:deoxyhypusine synthase
MMGLDEGKAYSSREFLWLFGKWLAERNIKCIVSTAYQHGVPVYSPALVDSGYGIACIHAVMKNKRIQLDQAEDFREFLNLCKDRRTGVIYIGGGVPKDFVQLVAVARDLVKGWENPVPHEYAIQITTDSPQWGGLSGCTLEEAVSWGKTSPRGKKVTCYCDATIALPLVAHALFERVKSKRKGPKFEF